MLSRVNTTAMLRSMLKNTVVSMQTMDFAKKSKKSQSGEGLSEYETAEDFAEPEVVFQTTTKASEPSKPTQVKDTRDISEKPWLRQTQVLDLDKSLFKPFSLGDVKVVTATPDNKAPSYEDTIEGRYANVLFTTASGKGALYEVYEDMYYLSELYKHSDVFRQFTENAGVGNKEIAELNKVLSETAEFNPITHHFLTILAENKRLIFIKDIAGKYQKLYQQFNKEEKITIISAETLTSVQQSQVLAAFQENPQNAGKAFTIEYQVDKLIQGGLQMYTESEFMDMSVASRMSRINEEVAQLSL